MKLVIIIYSVVCALALFAGETLVVLKTNKYWPLSLDDYIAVIALMASIYIFYKRDKALGLIAVYACGESLCHVVHTFRPCTWKRRTNHFAGYCIKHCSHWVYALS